MTDTMLTISAVHRITGLARSTITNHITKGKLSVVENKDGNRRVEASELIRVYEELVEVDENGELKTKTTRIDKSKTENESNHSHLQELLDRERAERDRERNQLQETIDQLRGDLDKSQERESRASALLESQTKLLEHQSKDADEWKKRMEDRLKNQGKAIRSQQQSIEAAAKKTIWQRLFRIADS